MSEIDKIIELLNTEESEDKIDKLYKKYGDNLFKEVRNRELFGSYLKSSVLVDYFRKLDIETKRVLYKQIEDRSIFSDNMSDVIFTMNAFNSKPGDRTGRIEKADLNELYSLEENELLEFLDDREDEIIETIKSVSGIVSLSELKDGSYKRFKEYSSRTISEEELKIIDYVKMIPDITNYIHQLYDDQIDGNFYCLYGDIKEEWLKPFAFYVKSKTTYYVIVLENDQILSYANGEFRFLPYTFSDMVKLTKLCFLSYYFNGAEDKEEEATLKMLSGGLELSEIPIDEMDKLLFEQLVIFSFDYIRSMLDEVTFVFSNKMIKEAREEVGKYKILTSKYRL